VSEPEVEKGKKKRGTRMTVHHRSERIVRYINENRPRVSSESFSDPHFDDDDDENVMQPDQTKATGATGNPVPHPSGANWADRVSPPIGPGHAAYGVGDHGAAAGTADPMNPVGPKALALGHPSMRMGATNPLPLFSMSTVNGDNGAGDRDIIFGAGRVAVSRLDAAAAAGMSGPPANPATRRMDHIAPINVGGPNGGHDLSGATSRPPMSAMKSSEALGLLAAEFRRQRGQ